MEPGAKPFDFGLKADPEPFEKLIADGYEVNLSDCLREGWEIFRSRAGEFMAYTLIIALVTGMLSQLDGIGSLLSSLISAPLYAGYFVYLLMLFEGRDVRFGDFFKGFDYFLPLLFAGFVSGFLVLVGTLLLILPGIYLAVGYFFTTMLIVDYRMDFWQAMETSRKIVTKNWFSIFVFALVLFALNVLGGLALLIGLFVTVPLSFCAAAVAYRDIVGLHSGAQKTEAK
ncbi:hypothetical protein CHL67_10110 [Prosthecochloris sp. GSB1]|uniref:hypothetical protein n=1 Tax=Prosthecochloris sp. GSB1 TaxID=281093 RepID=UPI000B8C8807|nr:hypothetical protein [Prosthecochloris sp. GSB1]ASQ91217.1 hypothetical protein CHL67_10110 [Prosthecochloris sp. GSB1]